jgi:CRISPR/Cas system-associated protein Cas10 (large subunit of type III CRISPR-Cas system)
MTAERKDLVHALAQSLKAIDDDYKEELRELRQIFLAAKSEAEKKEPDRVKLRALLADGNEMVKTFAGLDPVWQGVQRVAKLFGFL